MNSLPSMFVFIICLSTSPPLHVLVQNAGSEAAAPCVADPYLARTSGGSDYYVSPLGADKNRGTRSAPFRTIQHAAGIVMPGDTVHVLPGTYLENVVLRRGGTPERHIRYISEVESGAKVVGVGSAEAAFWAQTAPYTDIVGFDVSNPVGTQGIECYSTGCMILGNVVHDVPGSSAGGACIHTYPNGSTNIVIMGNIVHDCGPLSTTVQLTQGIYIESAGAVVKNNLVYHSQGFGICLFHTPHNDTVTDNTVFENGWGGIIVSGTASEYTGGKGVNDYTTVSNNIVVHNGWYGGTGRGGILEEGSSGPHNVYLNNLLWNNRFQGSTRSQINIQTGSASGNLIADPKFVNYQHDGSGDYHLTSKSPRVGNVEAVGAFANRGKCFHGGVKE